MNGKGPYSRIYWTIADDEMFAGIYDDDAALATWLRLLLLADATYPATAPLPRSAKERPLAKLVASGLVKVTGDRYRIRGLESERERRSESGRNVAAARWRNAGASADAMLDETRRAKKSSGGHNGQHKDCIVCQAAA